MHRINQIVQQLPPSSADSAEMAALKREIIWSSLKSQFDITDRQLRKMALFFLHEMHRGLESVNPGSTLPMLPSFVYKGRTSDRFGSFYALDLGGTNFRVIKMDIRAGKLSSHTSAKFEVPAACMSGTASQLFGFIAESVQKFIKSQPRKAQSATAQQDYLGFTFSFPINQTALDEGTLLHWTKGYTTSGVEGQNVVKLLQNALDARKIPMKVVALCNDTVGTLVARFFGDREAEMGVIVGTGSNACYWEKASCIKKCPKVASRRGEMCVNMEFGNFDSKGLLVLPVTPIDEVIDKESAKENMCGRQRLEKMVSGFYLGEICRHCFLRLADGGLLPAEVSRAFSQRMSFGGVDMTRVLCDVLPGRPTVAAVMLSHGVEMNDEKQLRIVQRMCQIVAKRSARLAGMCIGATLLKTGKHVSATIAVDGSVFEKQSGYRKAMHDAIMCIVGPGANIKLVHQADGSGHGAGFIAALAQ